MKREMIKEEFENQVVKTSTDGVVNVFDFAEFDNMCEVLHNEYIMNNADKGLVHEDDIVVMFFAVNLPNTLYRSVARLIQKCNKKTYLNDLFIGIFERDSLKINGSTGRYTLLAGAKPLAKKALISNLFSVMGRALLYEKINYSSAPPKVEEPQVEENSDGVNLLERLNEMQNSSEEGITQASATSTEQPTQPTQLNQPVQTTQPSQSTFQMERSTLAEKALDTADKVKSSIEVLASVKEKFKNKTHMYIINEKQLLNDTASISLFHIYVDKKFVSTTTPSEFPIVILSLIEKGPIEITEVEYVISIQGEWVPPEKL